MARKVVKRAVKKAAPTPPTARSRRRTPDSRAEGRWNEREISRLAEKGVEQSDIAQALGLVHKLAEDRELRGKFERVVKRGHAAFRVAIADRAHQEAVGKGRSTALIEVMRGWLARYMEDQLTPEEEAGLAERVNAEMERLKKARKRNAAA